MVKVVKQSFEILDEVNRSEMLKKIELAGRTCYKSENLITDETASKFVKSLVSRGHFSVLEHVNISVRLITNRGVTHELVRHRLASYSQECITGDTEIKVFSGYKTLTIKELYDRTKNCYGRSANNRITLRSVDDNRIISPNKMVEVSYKGVQDVYQIQTATGYKIKCTMNHKFLTDGGYVELSKLSINDILYVNGRPCLVSPSDGSIIKVFKDYIISIDYIGPEDTYDIEMKSPLNNYIANGFVVHNSSRYCNYSKDKFGNEITVIDPEFEGEEANVWSQTCLWRHVMDTIESNYIKLLEHTTTEYARGVLPNDLKTEIVVTANLREWKHIFEMRTSKAAHPHIRSLMKNVQDKFIELLPEVFEDE